MITNKSNGGLWQGVAVSSKTDRAPPYRIDFILHMILGYGPNAFRIV